MFPPFLGTSERYETGIAAIPDACFYMKDLNCRIMALNKRNCEVCNIKSELDVVGMRSDEVFTPADAESFMELDLEVQRTRKPALNRVETHPADKSPLHNCQQHIRTQTQILTTIIGRRSAAWHRSSRRVRPFGSRSAKYPPASNPMSQIPPRSPAPARSPFCTGA